MKTPDRKSLDRVFAMKFARVYPLYVQKAEGKKRTREEVDQIICCPALSLLSSPCLLLLAADAGSSLGRALCPKPAQAGWAGPGALWSRPQPPKSRGLPWQPPSTLGLGVSNDTAPLTPPKFQRGAAHASPRLAGR
jgi:hypothetical protein